MDEWVICKKKYIGVPKIFYYHLKPLFCLQKISNKFKGKLLFYIYICIWTLLFKNITTLKSTQPWQATPGSVVQVQAGLLQISSSVWWGPAHSQVTWLTGLYPFGWNTKASSTDYFVRSSVFSFRTFVTVNSSIRLHIISSLKIVFISIFSYI